MSLHALQMGVVGMAGAEEIGEVKTEDITCLAGVLGAVLALGSGKGIWVSEVHPEGTPMTTANTLLTLGSGLRTSCEMCIWSVAFIFSLCWQPLHMSSATVSLFFCVHQFCCLPGYHIW